MRCLMQKGCAMDYVSKTLRQLLAIFLCCHHHFSSCAYDSRQYHVAEPPQIRCYSCMSKIYDVVWPLVESLYKPPGAFTDRCNEENFSRRHLGIRNCSVCVSIRGAETVSGIHIPGYFRGCLSDIQEQNKTFLQSWLSYSQCRYANRKDLLRSKTHLQGHVWLCSCHTDLCNRTAHAKHAPLTYAVLMMLAMLTFLYSYVVLLS